MAEWALTEFPIDPKRLFYMGGSHGGYIGAWLATGCTSKYPSEEPRKLKSQSESPGDRCPFAGLILINPVTDLTLLLCNSDIPEWATNEAGLPLAGDFSKLTTAKQYDELWVRSPIRAAPMARRRLLILVGLEDRRVPPLNGIRFSQSISGIAPKLLCFPGEGHALDGVRAQHALVVAITRFLHGINFQPATSNNDLN